MVKRAVATLILLCAVCLTTACKQSETQAIRFGLSSAPINLDPRLATDAASERINRLLYRRLVDFDEASRPVPDLASWELIKPGHFRFRLNDHGRLFHDGTILDATDVAATYRSILDPATVSPHRKTLSMISKIRVIDTDTLDFLLTRHDTLFPTYLSIGIIPQKAIANGLSLAKSPVGSGPFKFGEWPQPGRLSLTRIEDSQTVIFEHVADPTMRVLKLMRGEIDLLQNDLPSELVSYLSDQTDVNIKRSAGNNFTYLGFNLENDKTESLKVRKAIALAIDRDAIIKYIFSGRARKASSLLPPSHWAGGKRLNHINRNLATARQLLAEAGYSMHNPLYLEYKTSSDPFRIRIATILQQQLAEAGIQLKISSYDWGTFYGDIKAGRFQLFSLTWVGIKTPEIFRYVFHSASLPPDGANRGRLNDPGIDKIIEAAELETDIEQKSYLYQQIQSRLLEKLPYVPLWYEDQFVAMRDTVKNYQPAADGNFDALVNTVKSSPKAKDLNAIDTRY